MIKKKEEIGTPLCLGEKMMKTQVTQNIKFEFNKGIGFEKEG